jgi:hypothetical protein
MFLNYISDNPGSRTGRKRMMHQKVRYLVGVVVLTLLASCASQAAEFSASFLGGYKGGASFRMSLMASEFAQGLPLGLEAALGYTTFDPGNPEDARRIFINDNENGTPEKSGWMWDVRLDFLYRLKVFGLKEAFVFAGVRYSMFTGNFKYVGGNEDFNVTSNQWGGGLGAKAAFPISSRVGISFLVGFDYFFNAALSGHDTSYNPSGENVNPKHNYTFSDADAAVNQPKFQPDLMIGFTFYF